MFISMMPKSLDRALHGLSLAALRLVPPETAHQLTLRALGYQNGWPALPKADPRLRMQVLQMDLPHPLGLAAGFDKQAEAMEGLLRIGLSFVEVGTVTPRPQPGNPRPRVFRLPRDRAVINRYGFNSQGMAKVGERLATFRRRYPQAAVGVNLGPNRDSASIEADLAEMIGVLGPLASYLVVNLSSPNTAGLRDNQAPARLSRLLDSCLAARARSAARTPLLVKLSPDLDEVEIPAIAQIIQDQPPDGLILTNSSVARPSELVSRHRQQVGGLSGAPLAARSTAVLSRFYAETEGQIPIIGVGGIDSPKSAYAKIRAGASLLQSYTGLVYQGQRLIEDILSGLPKLLEADGFASFREAVGADHRPALP